MTAEEFEQRVVAWAQGRDDVTALILAGSRAQIGAKTDDWADWDFHLITPAPSRFRSTAWLEGIAPNWCAHAAITPRGVWKVSAVFAGGWEVDFIPLAGWQMRLVYWAMRRPKWHRFMPAKLHRGIHETRAFMLGNGWRMLKGGPKWSERLDALSVEWPVPGMTAVRFQELQAEFWPRAVWLMKKIARGENRSAVLWLAKLNLEVVYPLLQEEARLQGRVPRPEARKAEQWLNDKRLAQTDFAAVPEPQQLADSLLGLMDLFKDVSRSVAAHLNYLQYDATKVETWLRRQLAKLAAG